MGAGANGLAERAESHEGGGHTEGGGESVYFERERKSNRGDEAADERELGDDEHRDA